MKKNFNGTIEWKSINDTDMEAQTSESLVEKEMNY